MPSSLHEMLVEMFRLQPSLAAELLAGLFGVDLPDHQHARLHPADCADLMPTEYRADAVVVLTEADEPVLAMVIEVQLSRDTDKRWSWPVYVATLRARLRCPTELLVVCADASVASWCGAPIALGLVGSWIVPMVVGPDLIPVITDTGRAGREPELAVLSALAHGGDPARRGVLDVLFDALAAVEKEHAILYLELIYKAMPDAAKCHLEGLIMSIDTQENLGELAQWLIAQGEARADARGDARLLFAVLDARGIDVPEAARTRIGASGDRDQLEVWARRAATAKTIDDLFD